MQRLRRKKVLEYVSLWTLQKRRYALDVLERATELVSAGWVRRAVAMLYRSGIAIRVEFTHPDATHFSVRGGVRRAAHEIGCWEGVHVQDRLSSGMLENACEIALFGSPDGGLGGWNDLNASQKDVLALYWFLIRTIRSTSPLVG